MRFAVIDKDRVVMPVQPVYQRLDRGFVEMAEIGGGLAGFLSEHKGLWVDQSEGVDDHLALDRLDRINDDGYRTGRQLLEGLLGVDIDAR